jgi:hypothetical protein
LFRSPRAFSSRLYLSRSCGGNDLSRALSDNFVWQVLQTGIANALLSLLTASLNDNDANHNTNGDDIAYR